jgi:DNA-binding transcriptional MerR regulator
VGEYQISMLAARSGFPASTLRFYEHAGLLPAERSPGGYRLYGDDALERLAFIAAAKGLGLALGEIRELLEVWEHGVCADVRARLRPLVSTRIREAEQRIAELSAFVTALSGVHADLTGSAPDGACAPGCGCMSAEQPNPAKPPPALEPIIACSLAGDEQHRRRGEWAQLMASCTEAEDTARGVRASFPVDPELAARLARLAAAEQSCCSFLQFSVTFTPTALAMTVDAPPSARPILADLFGNPA